MIETSALARPYALAAYEQATIEGTMAEWSASLELLGSVVSDARMVEMIVNPRVDDDGLTKLVLEVCEGRLSPTQENFVRLLVEAGRLSLAFDICALFERERAKADGRASVSVVSAFELDEAQRDSLSRSMAARLEREIDLEVSVDKTLIGGAIIRSGDVVIDASLRGRLRQLEAEFL